MSTVAKHTDLTRIEGEPTARADTNLPLPTGMGPEVRGRTEVHTDLTRIEGEPTSRADTNLPLPSGKWLAITYALANWGRTARLSLILLIMQTPADVWLLRH